MTQLRGPEPSSVDSALDRKRNGMRNLALSRAAWIVFAFCVAATAASAQTFTTVLNFDGLTVLNLCLGLPSRASMETCTE